ncbi:MAG: hypothetical protein U9Q92_00805 [archaeon]|nr:hypothetical protein [archaeon]
MNSKVVIAAIAVMMLFAAAPVYALFGPPAYADAIFGRVYYDDVPYRGATVNATCDDGNKSSIGTTNWYGLYRIGINCSAPNNVTVGAYADGGLYGTASGTMEEICMNVDMTRVNITMIPEFGLIGIPLLLSMAGFVFMRGKM